MSTIILRDAIVTAPASSSPLAMRPLLTRPVLLATDGTTAADSAVQFTAALAGQRRARPQVLTVLPAATLRATEVAVPARVDSEGAIEADRRARWLGDVERQLDARASAPSTRGCPWPVDLAVGRPAANIVQEARRRGAGLIVVGLRPHGTLDRLFRDETALLVVRSAAVPVLAVTPQLAGLPRRVIAAVDFSRASLDAARAALSVIGDGGTLLLAHVQPEIGFTPESAGDYDHRYAQGVAGAFERLREQLDVPAGVSVETVALRGEPTTELLALVDRTGADLVAVGSQGGAPERGAPHRPALGSVTRALVRAGRTSLLVAPPRPTRRRAIPSSPPRAEGGTMSSLSMRMHNVVETTLWLGAGVVALVLILLWLLASALRALVAPLRLAS